MNDDVARWGIDAERLRSEEDDATPAKPSICKVLIPSSIGYR